VLRDADEQIRRRVRVVGMRKGGAQAAQRLARLEHLVQQVVVGVAGAAAVDEEFGARDAQR